MNEKEKWTDPFVQELHAIREARAKKFNYDFDAMFDALKKGEEESKKKGFTIVSLPSKRHSKLTGTHS